MFNVIEVLNQNITYELLDNKCRVYPLLFLKCYTANLMQGYSELNKIIQSHTVLKLTHKYFFLSQNTGYATKITRTKRAATVKLVCKRHNAIYFTYVYTLYKKVK